MGTNNLPATIVEEYFNILSLNGPGSKEALEFRESAKAKYPQFLPFADSLDKIKRQLSADTT